MQFPLSACGILISFSFRDFIVLDSGPVRMEVKGFACFTMDLILQQNSILVTGGSLDFADSAEEFPCC
jgi:hypothetical protein